MRFVVERTSIYGDGKPCEEAYRFMTPHYDIRTCTEEYYDEKLSHYDNLKWRERGTEHTTLDNGHIRRRLDDTEVWGVDIESLSDLLEFSKKYGEIIIEHDGPSLEIYDDYRE